MTLHTARKSAAKPIPASKPARRDLLQRKCACGGSPGLDGECAGCRAKRLQCRETGWAEPSSVPPIVHEVLRSPGQPLDADTRAFMEPRFGHDFGKVRVHTDTRAAESASAVNALAYTVGRDIVFGAGQYAPWASEGRSLVAHELTHVVQQRPASGDASMVGDTNAAAEGEARAVASSVSYGGPQVVNHRGIPGVLMRQESEGPVQELSEEGPGFWGTVGGGLMGEFNEDPNFAMMGVDLGVSLIPILDQASDVRDILAHLYYLIFRKQYNRFMRWIGLVFTLIGLFPEIGSAIKGASKFVIKGVREVISHLAEVLKPFRRFLPEIAGFGHLQAYIARHWERIVTAGLAAWERTIGRVARIVDAVPVFVNRRVQIVRDGVARLREIAPGRLREAFGWVRRQWDNISERIAERLERPQTTSPISPERAAGFSGRQIRNLPRLLEKPLMSGELALLGQIWQQTTKAADVARLTLSNSRRLFNNHRNRFWRAVFDNRQARALLRSAGLQFGRRGTAPFVVLANGQRIRITIDHILERQTAPGRALDPTNLRLIFERENTVVLRLLHQLDPFQ